MSEHDNVQVIKKLFEAINKRDLSSTDMYYSKQFRANSPGIPEPLTLEESRANLKGYLDAFPDLKFKLVHTIAQGDFVVANWDSSGAHTGPFKTRSGKSIPPSGKKASLSGSTTYQFKDGKVIHSWGHWDNASLLGQMGLLPEV